MPSGITVHQMSKGQVWEASVVYLQRMLRLFHNITQKTLLLLSGGSAVRLYKPLRLFISNSDLNFEFLTIAQVDERFQPGNRDEVNAYAIEKTGLWEACKKKNIPYYLVSQTGSLQESSKKYNQTISKLFKSHPYKIAVFGIGEDGHTAGLLPGYKKEWNRNVFVVGYENKGKFHQRITVTPKALIHLDIALVVAQGEGKRNSLVNVLKPEHSVSTDVYPAMIFHEIPKVEVFTDIG